MLRERVSPGMTAILSLMLIAAPVFGASEQLNGVVRDVGSNQGEAGISGVRIDVKDAQQGDVFETLTNATGRFTISFPKQHKGSWVLFTKVGYQPHPLTKAIDRLQSAKGTVYLVREHASKSYLHAVAQNLVTEFSGVDPADKAAIAKVVSSLPAEDRSIVTAELERAMPNDMLAAIQDATQSGIVSARVRAALVADPSTMYDFVVIDAFKGTVKLSGFVDSSAAKTRAAELALLVDGVKDVRNELELSRQVVDY